MTGLLFLVLFSLAGWFLTWLLLRRRTGELAAKSYQLNMIRKAARAAHGGIYIYNVANNETYWDTNTIQMFGLSGTGRVIEQGLWEDMIHPDDREAATQTMSRVLASDVLFYDQSYRIIQSNGTVRWIEGSGYVTRDEKSRPIEITGLHFDITSQVLQNIDLEQSKYKAERAMEAKTQFLANMSHEIRTPMNAIIGMIELLDAEVKTPIQRRYLHTLQNSSEVLLRIINDVLDVSKIEAGKLKLEKKTFNLRNVLHQCFSIHTHISERNNILLTGYVDPAVPIEIEADSTRLQQVIINLLSNAFKFTQEGYIKLQVTYAEQGHLYFQIEDTGIGIDDEHKEKLFDRFTQADDSTTRKFGGTGLGLTIVKQIVELWRGKVWVTSIQNQGATFHFTLPTQASPAEVKPIIGNYLLASRFKPYFDLCKKASNAPNVQWVTTLDALERTLATKEIDHLIIEQNFPDKPGNEVITWCKKNYPKINTTLVGFETTIDTVKHEESVDEFLAKPFFINQIWDPGFAVSKEKAPTADKVKKWPDYKYIRVLCVDDNASNLIVLSGLLKRFGITCTQAISGRDAINHVKEHDFDLILMDYEMPDMDGPETTRQILAIKSTLIIGLSAHTGDVFKRKAELSGMKDFLRKPIRVNDLSNLLDHYFQPVKSGNSPKQIHR